MRVAKPTCFRLFLHIVRRAASRACCTAGNSNAIKTAMIAITTSSSINVKPRQRRFGINDLLIESKHKKGETSAQRHQEGVARVWNPIPSNDKTGGGKSGEA